eukprot:gb/GECH01010014.1/.p1 GENE.gb/GECH01010014.1/~~gb/GECH01010014.1/.p1  ORF type:complete len:453 (+),score=96.82 gb/GECH01010014.1/:1-1359(+)
MKIKTISRIDETYKGERSSDIPRHGRNFDPNFHPYAQPREYVRALVATKMDKIYAKPFVSALNGHMDSVNCLCPHPSELSYIYSAAADGDLRCWDIDSGHILWQVPGAHRGAINGLITGKDGSAVFTSGVDGTVKRWHVNLDLVNGGGVQVPEQEYRDEGAFISIDHHASEPLFATGGDRLALWHELRQKPQNTFNWGHDTVHHVRFNRVEENILAFLSKDRSIVLFDLRAGNALRCVTMRSRPNALSWNPYITQNFTVGCDDFDCYTFDMRRLDRMLHVHSGHVGPVTDIDYSPTGDEFASASWDKTLRLFPTRDIGRRQVQHSRDVYHTKRMNRVLSVRYSGDGKYVLCGSDDQNIRLWKAHSAELMRMPSQQEERRNKYFGALKKKYQSHQEIRSIASHHHVPMPVYLKSKTLKEIRKAETRKEKARQERHKKYRRPKLNQKRIVAEKE